MAEVNRELEDPKIWGVPEKAQALGKERALLESLTTRLDRVRDGIEGALELLELAEMEAEVSAIEGVEADANTLERGVKELEFQRMFPGQMDPSNAFLDIQAGAGGTEAQDWASMLLRMYCKWSDQHGFKYEILDQSDGEVAGIKGCSIKIDGPFA